MKKQFGERKSLQHERKFAAKQFCISTHHWKRMTFMSDQEVKREWGFYLDEMISKHHRLQLDYF